MKIRYIAPTAEKNVPVSLDNAELEVIRTVPPGGTYRLATGQLRKRNTSGMKLFICKLDCSLPVIVREDYAQVVPTDFADQHRMLLRDALEIINSYNGPKAVTLNTGEKAIDNDDAWLMLRQPDGMPVLRNKKEQRNREAGGAPGVVFDDTPMTKTFEDIEIFTLADSLSADNK